MEGIRHGLAELKPLLANNKYGDVALMLPGLLRDSDALNGNGRAVRVRVLNATGWVLTQTRQFDDAEPTLYQAIDIADDQLDAAAAGEHARLAPSASGPPGGSTPLGDPLGGRGRAAVVTGADYVTAHVVGQTAARRVRAAFATTARGRRRIPSRSLARRRR